MTGAVQSGGGVVARAVRSSNWSTLLPLLRWRFFCALEHQLLQDVGGTRGLGDLSLGPDPVSHHEGQSRAGVFWQQQDLETPASYVF